VKPKACALYHRVSTVDQNPELAREELRAAAARLGYAVALELAETGSGAANDRPGLGELLEAARRGKIEAVIVWKLDRFGRSALDLLANIRQLEDAGVRFVAVTQGIDIKPGGDPMSRLLLTMLAAVAEFERDLIRDRTLLGLARARANGTRLGRPRSAEPDPDHAARLRAAGMSWKQMAAELGCSPSAARRALFKNGVANSNAGSVGN
jgi:DNA invertase Pin-like site-specific DNA recombinase